MHGSLVDYKHLHFTLYARHFYQQQRADSASSASSCSPLVPPANANSKASLSQTQRGFWQSFETKREGLGMILRANSLQIYGPLFVSRRCIFISRVKCSGNYRLVAVTSGFVLNKLWPKRFHWLLIKPCFPVKLWVLKAQLRKQHGTPEQKGDPSTESQWGEILGRVGSTAARNLSLHLTTCPGFQVHMYRWQSWTLLLPAR